MRSAMKSEWIESQTSEMDGLWHRRVFQKVLRLSLIPQDRVFTSRFHYKIKREVGEFDKHKVRLVVQGQHMRRKGKDGVGDYHDAFSPVPAASGFRTIAASGFRTIWLHNKICLPTTSTFLRPSFRGNFYLETVTMERCKFLHLLDMMKILFMCIAC